MRGWGSLRAGGAGSLRSLLLVGGFSLIALVTGLAWVDSGEIGVLLGEGMREHRVEARLWIVEVDGRSYVRAATPQASWVGRVLGGPVRLQRGDTTRLVRAVPVQDANTRRAVDAAMRRKYGALDWAYGVLHGGEASLPVRLEPITATAFSR